MSEQGKSGAKRFRVAIIGTGRPHGSEGSTGFGMGGAHADGYNETGRCDIVALCDLVRERAEEFNTAKAGGKAEIYSDYHEMLADVKPDIVSICVWPALHSPMIVASAEAGVRAIHSEKPIAGTWGECRRAVDMCRERGVQLTFNHQRRFLPAFQAARRMITEGRIGKIIRMEGACGDLIDWGTHWLDMFGFYNDETPVKWVMAQVDCRAPKSIFGVVAETQGITCFEYENGVTGLLYTGEHANTLAGCANRIIGTDGVIELLWGEPSIRVRTKADPDWQLLPDSDTRGGLHGGVANSLAVKDLVTALSEGRTPLLDSSHAIRSTEIIFAAYESARRRGRVDAPLTIDDNPLKALIDSGAYPAAVPPPSASA